jgi:hypothetical protein
MDMAEVLVQYTFDVLGADGRAYRPRVCGRERIDGLWEGWLEFESEGQPPLRTARETTQPNRDDLFYWATGLTAAYLDGALMRTLRPPPTIEVRTAPAPAYDEPAPRVVPQPHVEVVRPRAVLDPFAVYADGDSVLRDQLSALDAGQLRNIVLAYGLSSEPAAVLEARSRLELMTIILEAVRERARRG